MTAIWLASDEHVTWKSHKSPSINVSFGMQPHFSFSTFTWQVPSSKAVKTSEKHWSQLDRPSNEHHLSSSVIYQIPDADMQVENSLGSLLFANQSPTNTQSGTTPSETGVEELSLDSQAQHGTTECGNNQQKEAKIDSKTTTANAKIFPWMKESRSRPKHTG